MLPPATEEVLTSLVKSARDTLKEDLLSVVLFGSGAEGRLRPSSDLNLLFILSRFQQERIDVLREPLRMARMAQKASVIFVLENELPLFADSFAVKFDDLLRRNRVLFGEDLLSRIAPSREARVQRLRQVLLNLSLRLRERYASLSLRDEQLVEVVTDVVSPMRAAAATLLELEGNPSVSGREALIAVVKHECPKADHMLEMISLARKTTSLPAGQGGPLLLQFMTLLEKLHGRIGELK